MNSKHNKLKLTHSIYCSVFWHLLILHHIHLEPIKLGCSLSSRGGQGWSHAPAPGIMRSVRHDQSGGHSGHRPTVRKTDLARLSVDSNLATHLRGGLGLAPPQPQCPHRVRAAVPASEGGVSMEGGRDVILTSSSSPSASGCCSHPAPGLRAASTTPLRA